MGKTANPFSGLEKRASDLVRDLDKMRSHLNTHEDYDTQLRFQLLKKIRQEAYKHSVAMEIETNVVRNRNELEKERRELEQHLTNGWDYLAENDIGVGSLSDLGSIVDPQGNIGSVGFRKTEVVIGEVSPAVPEKIPFLIDRLVRDIKEFEGYDLYRSVHTHLEIALIHPWADGNGRGARLLGDYTLQQRGLGAAVLHEAEKPTYTKLLREALKDQSNNKSLIYEPTPALLRFAEFIGQHSLQSLKHIERELEDNKVYYVRIEGIEKPQAITIKHMLAGLKSKFDQDTLVHVRDFGINEGLQVYKVKGPVTKNEIRKVIECASSKYSSNPKVSIDAIYV